MEFKILKKFKVGSIEYTVNMVEHCGNNECFSMQNTFGFIEIAKQSSGYEVSESRKRQTFFHKLTHAILGQMKKYKLNMMIIAVDFDGTCIMHDFPNVGKNIGAEIVLRKALR